MKDIDKLNSGISDSLKRLKKPCEKFVEFCCSDMLSDEEFDLLIHSIQELEIFSNLSGLSENS